jgi:polysaccharide transporter, PST family
MAKLATNIGSLYAVQIANYVLPLVTLPYLVRVLGIRDYGLLAFTYSVIQYFVILTDYGFNLSATRQVAHNREDMDSVGQIASAVFLIKGALMVLSAILLALVVIAIPDYRSNWPLFAVGFSLVAGNVLFPVWLYQGLEKMPQITVLNVAAKSLVAASIFVFVQNQDDLIVAVFLQSAGALFAGLGSVFVLSRFIPTLRLRWPGWPMVKQTLHEGWHIFLSQISGSLVSNSNVFILGAFHGSQSVGHYALAEKIIKAALNVQAPVCNAIFPRVGALFTTAPAQAKALLRRTVTHFLPVSVSLSICLFFCADLITRLIAGIESLETAGLLRIMALLPITVFLDNILGTQVLLNLGYRRQFMASILVAGLFGLAASLILVPWFGATASASVYLATEILLLGSMAWQVYLLFVVRNRVEIL